MSDPGRFPPPWCRIAANIAKLPVLFSVPNYVIFVFTGTPNLEQRSACERVEARPIEADFPFLLRHGTSDEHERCGYGRCRAEGRGSSSRDGLTPALNSGAPASGSSAPIEADAGVDCYDATPTGDGERVFVTVQRRLADFAV